MVNRSRELQLNVVTMMEGYCGHGRFEELMAVDQAAIRVSERSKRGMLSASVSSAKLWYIHWLDFGELPIDTPKNMKRPTTAKWTVAVITELRSLTSPVN